MKGFYAKQTNSSNIIKQYITSNQCFFSFHGFLTNKADMYWQIRRFKGVLTNKAPANMGVLQNPHDPFRQKGWSLDAYPDAYPMRTQCIPDSEPRSSPSWRMSGVSAMPGLYTICKPPYHNCIHNSGKDNGGPSKGGFLNNRLFRKTTFTRTTFVLRQITVYIHGHASVPTVRDPRHAAGVATYKMLGLTIPESRLREKRDLGLCKR